MSRLTAVVLTCLIAIAAAALAPAAASAAKTRKCLPRASSPQCYLWTGKVTFIADGDTLYVDIDGDGTRARRHVRITGINAMEQTVYASRASARRGDCHAVEATNRLEQLLRRGKMRVRLKAQDPASRSGRRLRRSISVRNNGRWVDVARTLVAEGHALWLPNHREYAWNREYSILAGRAARAGIGLWDDDYCGFGPSQGHPLQMWVNWDADGNDNFDPNGEWVRIKNPDPVNPMPIGGWWVRDSALRKYTFPEWATVPPGGHVTLYDGVGDTNETEFYWGLKFPAFENVTNDERAMGDGAYLFDPEGDLRLAMTYPCREGCTDPNVGSIRLDARPRGREAVQITNVGGLPLDLEPYRLTSRPYGYTFAPGSVLNPGETMRVRLWESWEEDDSRLIRYWPTNGPILNNGGDSVQLRRFDDVVLACTAWGDRTC
jgi:endonuclease YncB( thermonuclease family)